MILWRDMIGGRLRVLALWALSVFCGISRHFGVANGIVMASLRRKKWKAQIGISLANFDSLVIAWRLLDTVAPIIGILHKIGKSNRKTQRKITKNPSNFQWYYTFCSVHLLATQSITQSHLLEQKFLVRLLSFQIKIGQFVSCATVVSGTQFMLSIHGKLDLLIRNSTLVFKRFHHVKKGYVPNWPCQKRTTKSSAWTMYYIIKPVVQTLCFKSNLIWIWFIVLEDPNLCVKTLLNKQNTKKHIQFDFYDFSALFLLTLKVECVACERVAAAANGINPIVNLWLANS